MQQRQLKYGCNPNQLSARIYIEEGELPLTILNGNIGYINLLDALNGYQLVRELKQAVKQPAAASFKHVSPAGAAIAKKLSESEAQAFFVSTCDLSDIASAYARARGTDRVSSFGDFIALSDECDESCARLIRPEVSDGIIAPSYTKQALEILSKKRNGAYNIVKIDSSYTPGEIERRQVYGITFEQHRNDITIDEEMLKDIVTKNTCLTEDAKRDLLIALITLKYTQSNSVCYTNGGQTIGVAAGQQSRIHCTNLAGDKADRFNLRLSENVLSLPFKPSISRPDRDNAVDMYVSSAHKELLENWQHYFLSKPAPFTKQQKAEYIASLSGISLGSDAFFPFGDNIIRAAKSGVSYVVQAGGSLRDDEVIATANRYNMVMAMCHARFFHH
ncbi:MAG: phosphoribosylaminoimidazolecarboxamide formyltransferase [Oscillospiraceae bacterium]|nr:phosphoribosylaminoimidazolecarboxamide formyltransferase [Oscillospiraceae bacterium]